MRMTACLAVLGLFVTLLAGAPSARAASEFDLQAHRGGRGEMTEESLPAFAHALEVGVSTLELDVVITKDHQPLVWHDPKIDPTKCADTGPAVPGDPQFPYVGKLVHDLTLSQIRMLDCGMLLAAFPDAQVVNGNELATLPQVFELANDYRAHVRYNIETKIEAEAPETSAPPAEFVDVVLAATRAAGKMDDVEIQSFDWRTLPMVRRAAPGIPLVALWDETTYVPDSPWLAGVDPAVVKDPIDGALAVGANVLSPGYSVPTGLTPDDADFRLVADHAFVEKAHRLGLKVIPWTINDPGAMGAQMDAGADGIITDYPTRLRSVMAARGMSLPPAYQR